MKRLLAVLLACLMPLGFAGCGKPANAGTPRMYRAETDIHSLQIEIGAADFTIEQADALAVESDLSYLTVSEADGVWRIVEQTPPGARYQNPVFTLYLPENTTFSQVKIQTGAARLTADALSADALELQIGAGDLQIARLDVKREAEILGGAGKIRIDDGSIRNLDLVMGVGELTLTAALLGDCDLEMGVGGSELTLLGGRETYRIELEKGIGVVTVDGKEVAGFASGSGENRVEIEGGIGAIRVAFS